MLRQHMAVAIATVAMLCLLLAAWSVSVPLPNGGNDATFVSDTTALCPLNVTQCHFDSATLHLEKVPEVRASAAPLIVERSPNTPCFSVTNPKTQSVDDVCPRDFVDSRNPCFRYADTLFCMPFFYLAGVSKAGTSTLYSLLVQNPYVVKTIKETGYFVESSHHVDTHFLQDYLCDNYAKFARCVETRNPVYTGNMIFGDYSPGHFWRQQSSPAEIAKRNPSARIIVLLRDPIDRTWSDFKWRNVDKSGKVGEEDLAKMPGWFHERAVEVMKRFGECFAGRSVRRGRGLPPVDTRYTNDVDKDPRFRFGGCAYKKEFNFRSTPDLHFSGSLYAYFLYHWLQYFPPEQILLITNEAMRDDKVAVAFEAMDFLGLPRYLYKIKKDHHTVHKPVPPMFDETRELLKKWWRPHNALLRALVEERGIRVVGSLDWEDSW